MILNIVINIIKFLSRLCGGESVTDDDNAVSVFLSRLCGGEYTAPVFETVGTFLSRLCGGECNVRMSNQIPNFLSRLCGGEYNTRLANITKTFLSRLCGGEFGSITKCHVTRYGGGLQSRAKNKAPFEKTPSCGFFHNGAMVLLGVSFSMCLGWSANSPRRFARGGWNMRRQPCKS